MFDNILFSFQDRFFQFLYIVAYRLKLFYNQLFYPVAHGVYVAVWYKDEILLIKNSYKNYYTLPCGGLHKNESPKHAAVRELNEEVNIYVDESQLKLVGHYTSQIEYMQDNIILYEIILSEYVNYKCDNREVIWAAFEEPNKVLNKPLFPVVRSYLSNKVNSYVRK